MTAPIWQSRTLITLAVAATVAIECASIAYAAQSASRSQVLDLGFGPIQTDVLLKTLMSVAAGAAVVIGSVVAAHQWRRRHMRGRLSLAWIAVAVTAVGFVISTSNLSGYFAWVREQRAVEVVRDNPLYMAAAANAARVARGELLYLTGDDRRILREAQQVATADRTLGDVGRAGFMLALVAGMATGYRLTDKRPGDAPEQGKAKPKRRRRRASREEPAQEYMN